MQFMNFKEWMILTEMQWMSVDKITSLQGSPFFLFDDKPVTSIDFRFERMGFNRLNSLDGARWYAEIPDRVRFADGQEIFIEPTGGKFIVVNSYYRNPNGSPYVLLTNRPGKAAYEQVKSEIRQRHSAQHDHIAPNALNGLVDKDVATLPPLLQGANALYVRLPKNWINYSVLVLHSNHQRTPPAGNLIPFGQEEVVDMLVKTTNNTQTAVA